MGLSQSQNGPRIAYCDIYGQSGSRYPPVTRHYPPLPVLLGADQSAGIEWGRRAGARTILVMTGCGSEQTCSSDWRAPDVTQAIRLVLDLEVSFRAS